MTLEDLIQRLALKPDDEELRRLMAYELIRAGYGPSFDPPKMAEQINAMHAAMLAKMEARARHSREVERQQSRRNVSGVSDDEIASALERYRLRGGIGLHSARQSPVGLDDHYHVSTREMPDE